MSVAELIEVTNCRRKIIRSLQANNQPVIVDTRIGHVLVEASEIFWDMLIVCLADINKLKALLAGCSASRLGTVMYGFLRAIILTML